MHALDTELRTAVCIDLDTARACAASALELHGGRLDVLAGAQVLAGVDTSTHEVIPRRAAARPPAAPDEAGFPWLAIAAPTAALLLLAVFSGRRLGRKRAPTVPGTIDG